MTVCIAAICQWGGGSVIVGAADRMRTYGDIEYEPEQTKLYAFTNRVVALIAGDSSNQRSICDAVFRRTKAMVIPPNVATVAEIYAQEFANFRRVRNEKTILAPLGLNARLLLSEAQGIAQEQVSSLMHAMQSTNLGDEAIITGWDEDGGAHAYIIADPGVAISMDSAGWAAIGSGRWHAESHFTVQGYTPFFQFDEALLLVYEAKRRADVAPGVGEATDIFFIGSNGWFFLNRGTSLHDKVEELYRRTREQERQIRDQGKIEMKQALEEIVNASRPAGELEQPAATGEQTNEEDQATTASQATAETES
ncbi:MAG TPA: hypothetical protein VJB57_04405 [Dehalococcoidia bacterium]|nr:hypothetical protein [Dehalococcoidia bacterium]